MFAIVTGVLTGRKHRSLVRPKHVDRGSTILDMGLDTQKEEIRRRVPIEDLIRDYNVQLQPSGRGFKALCPFHAEKTPSFHVNVERQYYNCFGCEERGDIFTFVQKFEGVDFPQALELLARRAGVELKPIRGSGRSSGKPNLAQSYDALAFASEFYYRLLLESPAAEGVRRYLQERGIARSSWERFQLGFSPQSGNPLLAAAAQRGFSAQLLESVGLARADARSSGGGYCDYFFGRLMFPITDPQRRTVGFGARILGPGEPKYLNTPKTPLFDKSRLLYGVVQGRDSIRRQGRIAICEGYTDVIMAHQAGLEYFVASLGTAFTEENAKQIHRLASDVWLLFDGDSAGQKASERSLELLVPEDLNVRVYPVPDGKDPCDAIRESGGEAFQRELVDNSFGIFEFKWRRSVAAADNPNARAKALDDCLRLLARVRNVVRQKLLLKEFAERIGVDESVVEARFKELSSRPSRLFPRSLGPDSGGRAPAQRTADGSVGPPGGEAGDEAVGETGRSIQSPGERELAQTVLECVLALSHNATTMWEEVPNALFQDQAYRELVAEIERQLQEGELSKDRLMREVESAAAKSELISVLDRIESDDNSGPRTREYEERWEYACRDIDRYRLDREISQLRQRQQAVDRQRDSEQYREVTRSIYQLMRQRKTR